MKCEVLGAASGLVVAAGLFMGGAAYAGGSIGGDCCADLEERVAELEATTARKGNRKVSLTIYGQVNKAILFWERKWRGRTFNSTDIINNPLEHTNFGLRGSASISSDLYAGYNIEFDVTHDTGNPLELTRNELYVGSKTFGRLTIGHGSTATDGIAEIDLSGTKIAGGSNSASLFLSSAPFAVNGDGREMERIRYDSPILAGFKVSAAWTEDDDYDVALRYGASLGDFTVAAGIGYQEIDYVFTDDKESIVSGSLSLLHQPTGLNVTVARAHFDFPFDETLDAYYVKGGIKRNYFGIGDTALSADYYVFEIEDDKFEKIGFQLVQNVDAAAMELYLSAWSLDLNQRRRRSEDALMIGSRIRF